MTKRTGLIFCFGEVLWDCLPEGIYIGGAPLNVAYHLRQHDFQAAPVTAVGPDELGHRLLQQMQDWKLDTRFVAVSQTHPTGTVKVSLAADGSARYDITKDVAWDHIQVSIELIEAARHASALVFGTLAARSADNRARLAELRQAASGAMQIYDVNLRPPFDDHQLIRELARDVDLIKLNDDELGDLLGQPATTDSLARMVIDFSRRFECPRVCVTAGARGAGLLMGNEWYWANGRAIIVRDTIGAGDAFLASLIAGLLSGDKESISPQEALERACRLGEFVAASDGATPSYHLTPGGDVNVE